MRAWWDGQWLFCRTATGYERQAASDAPSVFIHQTLTAEVNRTWRHKLTRWTSCIIFGHGDAGEEGFDVDITCEGNKVIRRTFCPYCRSRLVATEERL